MNSGITVQRRNKGKWTHFFHHLTAMVIVVRREDFAEKAVKCGSGYLFRGPTRGMTWGTSRLWRKRGLIIGRCWVLAWTSRWVVLPLADTGEDRFGEGRGGMRMSLSTPCLLQ